jgi:cytoskeletal protein RodZ
MIDWLTIIIALVIIVSLIGGFGFLAWKINMPDPLVRDETNPSTDSIHDKRRKEKNSSEQSKKKRKDQKKSKRENKDDEEKQQQKRNKPLQTSEETDDEREESEQVNYPKIFVFFFFSLLGIIKCTNSNC